MTGNIYQLKITLKGARPPIWRRVQVHANVTLYQLHEIIQVAMGWFDDHLYEFQIAGDRYGDDQSAMELGGGVAGDVGLATLIRSEGARFTYTYDFGDNWEHVIDVEKILDEDADGQYPRCVDGQRACPPEDVGGVWGYEAFLEVMRDPKHPEHEERLEWVGEEFDPEEFDKDVVNQVLRGEIEL